MNSRCIAVSAMSLQERIVRAGKKIEVQSKTRLTADQLEAYERAVLLSIPTASGHAVASRVDRAVDGIIVAFVANDKLNLCEIALRLQERHASIFDEIRVMSDGHAIYIRFKTLPPYSLCSSAFPAFVCWVVVFALVGCKLMLGQDEQAPWTSQ